MTRFFLTLALVGILATSASAQEGTSAVEKAYAQAQQTGQPILIVAGSKTCGACQALKEELTTNARLRPVLSQFVALPVDLDDQAESRALFAKLDPKSNGIPWVWVVRADGTELHHSSGFMPAEQLGATLVGSLQQAGKPLNARQVEQVASAVADAKESQAAGDMPEAVRHLMSAQRYAAGSYAQAAVEAQQLATTLTEEGQAKLAEFRTQLEGTPDQAAIIAFLEAKASYGMLPDLKSEYGRVYSDIKRRAETRELVRTAEAELRKG